MQSELKRLKELSKCKHLTKTDRDAILWALVAIGEVNEPEAKQDNKGYPDEFEWLWKNYPERNGGKGDKRKAMQCCQARIKQGEDWKSLARYMKAYEEHCKRDGKIGTSYVMQFVTFFGPGERYKDDYSEKKTQEPEKKGAQQSLIDRANSGELYETRQDFYEKDGKRWSCMADYYAGKPPIT